MYLFISFPKILLSKAITLFTALAFITSIHLNAQLFIEAEDFSNSIGISQTNGIDTEGTSDSLGGLNVGWIDNNDWVEYEINIPVAGDYEFNFRAASENGGGIISIEENGASLGTVSIPKTNDWQNWVTSPASSPVNLTAGEHTLRLKANPGGFNLNWWTLKLVSPVDNDNPSSPTISKDSSSHKSIYLTLEPTTDVSSAVAFYHILSNDKLQAYVSDTNITLTGLSADSTYKISVIAFDLAGNSSSPTDISIKTDTIPWNLAWSDEFDYTGKPDPTKWRYETGGDGWGNGEYQYYTAGDNADVANGVLVIEARKEAHGNNDFTSTRLNSKDEVDFLFGRIEVKAKLPSTNGTWPAIWTLPTDWIYGGWPDCGEIDIMEHSATYNYGNVFGTIHTGAYNHQDGTQKSGGISFDDVTDTYHTYAIEWYPDYIEWFIDDMLVFHFDNEYKTTAEWPYDIAHHLILNVAIGGGLGGTVDYNGEWPQQMIVDYVRVYDFELDVNDTIAPEAPTNVSSDPKWATADVSWNLAKDNHAIEQYYIFLDNVKVDSILGSEYQLTDLIPLTDYTVGIQAVDHSGNLSDTAFHTFSTPEKSGFPIPGKVQAEDFTEQDDVNAQSCDDVGGGENLGWIDPGDWMTYTIDVKEDIEYRAGFRVAAQDVSGSLQLLAEDNSEITTITTPKTGGWQSWTTVVSEPFTLTTGIQTVKITTSTGDFNINWFEIKGKDDFVGINQISSESVVMYPNPMTGNTLTILLPSNEEKISVTVTGTDGKQLYNQYVENNSGQIQINDLNLKQGVYFVSLITNKQVYTQTLEVY